MIYGWVADATANYRITAGSLLGDALIMKPPRHAGRTESCLDARGQSS
jgi:hypothetical protein